jgi:hypothetical protein
MAGCPIPTPYRVVSIKMGPIANTRCGNPYKERPGRQLYTCFLVVSVMGPLGIVWGLTQLGTCLKFALPLYLSDDAPLSGSYFVAVLVPGAAGPPIRGYVLTPIVAVIQHPNNSV